ncbi:MAG: hypothetical protein K2L80_04695 [Muribaculaceae bacterium]|nr:hypothetical protein [Muribaculaceae bacterium]MDE6331882.1 hypothetical protein [Muribaculaceae bacterium]
MKHIVKSLLACIALTMGVPAISAQVQITKVDKIQPNEGIFMDMAVSAAKTSVADNGLPCGAVVILNGAWRSTGIPSNEISAEQTAINKSRAKSLANASIFTMVQPTAAACKAILESGAPAVYFAIPANVAIAAGIYPASAYEGAPALPKLIQLDFADADAVVNGWKAKK